MKVIGIIQLVSVNINKQLLTDITYNYKEDII